MKALLEWLTRQQQDRQPVQCNGLCKEGPEQLSRKLNGYSIQRYSRLIRRWGGGTKKQRLSQHYYNRHDRDLSPIRKGYPVFVQALNTYDPVKRSQGTIADRCSDRSYIVEIEGRLLCRNRRYLRNDATPTAKNATATANNATPAEQTANNVVAGEVSLSNEPPEAVVEAEPTSPVKATPVKTR